MADYDIAVVGGGLAGQVAALAFADAGYKTALVAPASTKPDGRTTALMDQSISFLDRLGVWEKIRPFAAPLKTMQIIDATDRLLRAPVVAFRSSEIGLPAFGYNIPNAPLLDALAQAVATNPNITRLETAVECAELDGKPVLHLASGAILSAHLIVGADGRASIIRQSANIGTRSWVYPQTAIVLNFSHSQPHHNISTEFHTPHGPFTQVSLPGPRSSLVWVMRPEDAFQFTVEDRERQNRQVEDRMSSMLGKIMITDEPQAWPLSGMTARQFGKGAVILIGEAAHVFPPIGAQGLNLSLRDIMTAMDMVGQRETPDIDLAMGDRFDRLRRADILTRTTSVDLLNRSLLSDFLPIQMMRAAGLQMLASFSPLRKAAMREGVTPGGSLNPLRQKIGHQQA